jgi:hypothetical protein
VRSGRLLIGPLSAYIGTMVLRAYPSRGRAKNAPAAFIQPCRPTVAKQPPRGEGWARDVTEDIAHVVLSKAQSEPRSIGIAAQEFLLRVLGVAAPMGD